MSSKEAETIKIFCASLSSLGVEWRHSKIENLTRVLKEISTPPIVISEWLNEALDKLWKDAEVPLTPDGYLDGCKLDAANTGVTSVLLGIADYGTLLLPHDRTTEAVSLIPAKHVAVIRSSDVVPNMSEALRAIAELSREPATSLIMATGPSATADMGALVKGAHGPKRVEVVILDSE